MAVDTSNRYSKTQSAYTMCAANSSVYDKDANPRYALGTRLVQNDRVFKYAHFGADVNRGVLVSQDLSESSVVDTDNVIIAPASAQTTSDGTIGSRFVEITLASITANQFAGGFFITTDDTGEGYTYRIRGNTATDDPASGNFRLELEDALQVAVDGTTDFCIRGTTYGNLEIATTTDAVIAGVTAQTMDVSEQAWGWIQTWGPCGVLTDGTLTVGGIVTLSDGTSGAVQPLGGGGTDVADIITEPLVGWCDIIGDSTGHSSIYLQLSP